MGLLSALFGGSKPTPSTKSNPQRNFAGSASSSPAYAAPPSLEQCLREMVEYALNQCHGYNRLFPKSKESCHKILMDDLVSVGAEGLISFYQNWVRNKSLSSPYFKRFQDQVDLYEKLEVNLINSLSEDSNKQIERNDKLLLRIVEPLVGGAADCLPSYMSLPSFQPPQFPKLQLAGASTKVEILDSTVRLQNHIKNQNIIFYKFFESYLDQYIHLLKEA